MSVKQTIRNRILDDLRRRIFTSKSIAMKYGVSKQAVGYINNKYLGGRYSRSNYFLAKNLIKGFEESKRKTLKLIKRNPETKVLEAIIPILDIEIKGAIKNFLELQNEIEQYERISDAN